MHTQNYDEWQRAATLMGCTIEPDGSGKLAAHIEGDEYGSWDPKYAGVGMGTLSWLPKV